MTSCLLLRHLFTYHVEGVIHAKIEAKYHFQWIIWGRDALSTKGNIHCTTIIWKTAIHRLSFRAKDLEPTDKTSLFCDREVEANGVLSIGIGSFTKAQASCVMDFHRTLVTAIRLYERCAPNLQ